MVDIYTGFHDVFALYGRPRYYNWDRDDPQSLFFGYYGLANMNVSGLTDSVPNILVIP